MDSKIEHVCETFKKIAADDKVTQVEINEITKEIREDNLSYDGTKALVDALFTTCQGELKEQEDKNKISCLKKVVTHLIDNFFDKKAGLNDCLFFPSQDNEKKLINYLGMAKKTMEVCVFTISNDRLSGALEAAHKRGVHVSDDECATNKGSDIFDLAEKGIPTRTDNSKAHMHNKYVLIDGKILITGSFNWTVSAVKDNQENLVVIEHEALVKKYSDSFEKLWKDFEKNKI